MDNDLKLKVMEINQGWHKISGLQIEDLEGYIFNYLKNLPQCEIWIGTDGKLSSLGYNRFELSYLSVICFYNPGKGAHIIKRKNKQEVKYQVSTAHKLNGEINLTSELALWFREHITIDPEIHIDVNPSESAGSFEVYKYIKGYFEALGLKTKYKSDSVAAFAAADYYL